MFRRLPLPEYVPLLRPAVPWSAAVPLLTWADCSRCMVAVSAWQRTRRAWPQRLSDAKRTRMRTAAIAAGATR